MNEYVREEYDTLSPGLAVHDANGVPVGTVGTTVGSYVELRGGDQISSYWIRRSEFGEAKHEAISLGFASDEIGTRALTEPPEDLDESTETGALQNVQKDQRELMLEELAEQRAEMREEGRATDEADENVGVSVEEEIARHQR